MQLQKAGQQLGDAASEGAAAAREATAAGHGGDLQPAPAQASLDAADQAMGPELDMKDVDASMVTLP